MVENKPNNKHHKISRHFTKTPGQQAASIQKITPRRVARSDEKRYSHSETPMGDSPFAAQDPLVIKNGKILRVASSGYLCVPRSLILTGRNFFDSAQSGLRTGVGDGDNMDPQAVITTGSNDSLQSQGRLNSLIDGSCLDTKVIGVALLTILFAMLEAEKAENQCNIVVRCTLCCPLATPYCLSRYILCTR